MKTVEMDDAGAAPLSDFVHQALTEPVVITLKGKPVAELTAIGAATDIENLIVSNDSRSRALVERSRALDPAGTGLSTAEVRRRLTQRRRRARRAGSSGKRRSAIARRRRGTIR